MRVFSLHITKKCGPSSSWLEPDYTRFSTRPPIEIHIPGTRCPKFSTSTNNAVRVATDSCFIFLFFFQVCVCISVYFRAWRACCYFRGQGGGETKWASSVGGVCSGLSSSSIGVVVVFVSCLFVSVSVCLFLLFFVFLFCLFLYLSLIHI